MARKKICNSFPQKPAQTLLVLLLSIGGCMALPHHAVSQENTDDTTAISPGNTDNATQNFSPSISGSLSPALIQSWKDYLKKAPALIARYQRDEAASRQTAKVVVASEVKNMDDLLRDYPFLQQDFQNVKDMQQKVLDYMNAHPDETTESPDISPHIQVAEDRDPRTGINVLFVGKSGKLWRGAHGAIMDVYVDTGTGYQKANSFIVKGDIYIARVDGQVALFLASPQDPNTPEFILSDHTFVKNMPPEPEPESQGFVQWRHEMEQAGQWPPR